jgi:hypothetical protein
MGRLWWRAFTTAVLLPAVLLAFSGTAEAVMLCKMMGVTRGSCCCPASTPDDDAPEGAQAGAHDAPAASVSAPPCCSVLQVEAQREDSTPARGSHASSWLPALVLVALGPLHTFDERVRPPRPVSVAHAKPPDGGRAVLLTKRSFLI